MRSAASAYEQAAAGVVLSGTRDDGAAGLLAIKQRGGYAVVQDPEEALYDGMPRSAMAHVEVDAVLRADEIGRWLMIRGRSAPLRESLPELVDVEGRDHPPGSPTRFTCPDCGGVVYEDAAGSLVRYSCSVGHAYSHESLLGEQERRVEQALWTAIRSLEERGALLERLAERARAHGDARAATSFAVRAEDVRDKAATIRVAVRFPPPRNERHGPGSPLPSEA